MVSRLDLLASVVVVVAGGHWRGIDGRLGFRLARLLCAPPRHRRLTAFACPVGLSQHRGFRTMIEGISKGEVDRDSSKSSNYGELDDIHGCFWIIMSIP